MEREVVGRCGCVSLFRVCWFCSSPADDPLFTRCDDLQFFHVAPGRASLASIELNGLCLPSVLQALYLGRLHSAKVTASLPACWDDSQLSRVQFVSKTCVSADRRRAAEQITATAAMLEVQIHSDSTSEFRLTERLDADQQGAPSSPLCTFKNGF